MLFFGFFFLLILWLNGKSNATRFFISMTQIFMCRDSILFKHGMQLSEPTTSTITLPSLKCTNTYTHTLCRFFFITENVQDRKTLPFASNREGKKREKNTVTVVCDVRMWPKWMEKRKAMSSVSFTFVKTYCRKEA